MKITRKHLDEAVGQDILSSEQAHKLFEFLASHKGVGPSFDITHVLYYLGGMIAIGAMTLFMTLGWEQFGGWGIVTIGVVYIAMALGLSGYFKARSLAIPAGICATLAVAVTPLVIYGLQVGLGVWPDDTVYRDYHRHIKWHWLYLELGTLAMATIAAWLYRYPFMMLPIAATLWYLSMDLAAMLAGGYADFELRALVSMHFGLAMTLLAFWVDIRSQNKADYAFWLYLFGVMTFWGGLTSQNSDSELAKLGYFAINLGMISVGVVLLRRVFVIFGALGACFYLGHLAHNVFENSWLFPFILTAVGLGIIALGVVWQRNEQQISKRLRAYLPKPLAQLLEQRSL